MTEQLTACISGTFKLKPEIDLLIEEFQDYGVEVLEPTKGWLYIPTRVLQSESTFRPLPLERGLSLRQTEDRFLAAVRLSHFLYLHNRYAYLGLSSAFEIGFALAIPKPVFALEPLLPPNFDLELDNYQYAKNNITVATPAEATEIVRQERIR